MRLFAKKEKIILTSEQQKEEFVEKLENAHVYYNIREDDDAVSNKNHRIYIVRMYADDVSKVK